MKSDSLPFEVLLGDLLEQLVDALASQGRGLVVQAVVLFDCLEGPLLLSDLPLLQKVLFITDET